MKQNLLNVQILLSIEKEYFTDTKKIIDTISESFIFAKLF